MERISCPGCALVLGVGLLTGGQAYAADASFGTDLSLSAGATGLLGDWPRAGVHPSLGGRFDAFLQPRDSDGPRLGLSLFAAAPVLFMPWAEESYEGEAASELQFSYYHLGTLLCLRQDPALPWAALTGLGFSRLDLDPYYEGPYAVPMFTLELGIRHALEAWQGAAFVDGGLLASWGSVRTPGGDLSDLWLMQASISFGLHAR